MYVAFYKDVARLGGTVPERTCSLTDRAPPSGGGGPGSIPGRFRDKAGCEGEIIIRQFENGDFQILNGDFSAVFRF